MKRLRKPAEWIILGLLAYIPFHVLLSTWLGTSFGALTAAKIAKDVIALAGFLLAAVAVSKMDLRRLAADKLMWLIGGYGLLTIILAIMRPTEQDAEVLGVVYNLRFLVFFLYGLLVMSWQKDNLLLKKALKIILVAGLIVSLLGVFQYLLLPDAALQSVGYSKQNGTPAAFFIDDKPNLERVMSTLKDPNSLGSYLIIITALVAALALRAKEKLRQKYLIIILLCTVCLWLTFSRGAVLGLVLAIAALTALQPGSRKYLGKYKKVIAISLVTLLIVVTGGLTIFKDSYVVRNVIFHADEQTVLEDPNELRLRFWRESISGIADDPFGSGPGTAGLASIRNQAQGTELNENYYLQIASEIGIAGLLLFIAIIAVLTKRLYGLRELPIARGLLASLIGLLFTSLLIHTWSNEAIAYVWWGLAGLVVVAWSSGSSRRPRVSKDAVDI